MRHEHTAARLHRSLQRRAVVQECGLSTAPPLSGEEAEREVVVMGEAEMGRRAVLRSVQRASEKEGCVKDATRYFFLVSWMLENI